MQLIDEWKKAYKLLSVQAMVLAVAIQGAWVSMPPDVVAMIDPKYVHLGTAVLLVMGIFGRLVAQPAVISNESK
jgi:hypothetical protein